MFSPVKAIAAGALVFALGGMFLIAQLYQQQDAVPAAETRQQGAVVTGTMVHHDESGTSVETIDAVEDPVRIDFTGTTGTIETSDQRLTGDVTVDGTLEFVQAPQVDPPSAELGWGTISIQTAEGRWEGQMSCVPTVVTDGYEDPCFYRLVGKDAYEGLSAELIKHERLEIDGDGQDEVFVVDGLIFAGNLPPDR